MIGGDPADHLTLFDVTDCAILPQHLSAYAANMLANPVLPARRIAFVLPNTLAKLQVTRLHTRPNLRLFLDVAGARQWLFEVGGKDPAALRVASG